ncbi:GNAT family N-acetyltransferase [Vibrio sp. SS-MA-C1-2]|uniref:GNAT family N-acetyltransferase n=1 Tax=Vibrio sp. SS-MA-C1-2 TaxID=2908646 RepID=UPI001F1B66CD|nr:GNAT family N-acetyltransferase [Vibrio sp. SS-MA-C1-2]UJF17911.1 GNAT family N-acetyltransferase [Vibrio sp. SS-MA-C1-2]
MLETDRLILEPISYHHAPALYRYYCNNADHLEPWEPTRDEDFYTLRFWQQVGLSSEHSFSEGREFRFALIEKSSQQLIGVCNFTCVMGGAFQACYLGYSIDHQHQNQGLMSEGIKAGIDFIFNEVGLNRIMANYLPHNRNSARVLEKLGFEIEGRAKRYLKIDGKWQDHILTAKVR